MANVFPHGPRVQPIVAPSNRGVLSHGARVQVLGLLLAPVVIDPGFEAPIVVTSSPDGLDVTSDPELDTGSQASVSITTTTTAMVVSSEATAAMVTTETVGGEVVSSASVATETETAAGEVTSDPALDTDTDTSGGDVSG